MGPLSRIFSWIFGKLAYAALLSALGLIGAGLWIFLHELGDFTFQHNEAVRALTLEKVKLSAALVDADRRILATQTRVAALQLRAEQAAKVANELEDLSSGIDWLTTGSDQLKENKLRLVRMREMETNSLIGVSDLRQSLVRIQWEKDGMEIAVNRNQTQLKTAEEERSALLHYARAAWEAYGKGVLFGVAFLMLAPMGLRLMRFSRS